MRLFFPDVTFSVFKLLAELFSMKCWFGREQRERGRKVVFLDVISGTERNRAKSIFYIMGLDKRFFALHLNAQRRLRVISARVVMLLFVSQELRK